MGILGIILLVFFVIIAILLILLVLVQNEEGEGLGGLFGGGSSTAFGARSGNVLTRTTTILGTMFLVISLGLAIMNRTTAGSRVEQAGRALTGQTATDWFMEDETSEPWSEAESENTD